MLVLARKKGQSINVGKNIKIFVVGLTGESVKLGIEAPPELEIFRTEIYRQLQEENKCSITSPEEAMGYIKIQQEDIKKME